jgi:hypothetical protein
MIAFPLVVRGLICHGLVLFCAVRLTGGGSDATVRWVLRPGRVRTGPPPAPRALRLGAAKGWKRSEAG